MKENEVMIGDWVRIVDDDTDAFFDARVEGIDSLANIYATMPCDETAYPYSVDCAKPILLTPEILEKNGFAKEKEDELGITYYFLERPYTTQITLYKEPIQDVSILFKAWGRAPSSAGGVNDIHLCSVKYVHEMQHALRLCGIEKEIVL